VDVLALGGTIAMQSTHGRGVSPVLSASDLVAAVPGLSALADVHATSVRTVPGASLAFADLVETARRRRALCRRGSRGRRRHPGHRLTRVGLDHGMNFSD